MRYLLEVWNPSYTERLAVATRVIAAERRRVLLGEETLDVSIPFEDPAAEHIVNGVVLRLQGEIDTPEPHSLWRLSKPRRIHSADDVRTVVLQARALWMDFIEGLVRQQTAATLPSVHEFGLDRVRAADVLTDYIVPGYEGYGAPSGWLNFEVGNIEPAVGDRIVTMQFDRTTPLAALRMLEREADCEAVFRLSGSVYLIDLVHRTGSQTPVTEIAYERNLRGLERAEDDTDVISRIRAWGDGDLTLADARWTLRAVPGLPQRWSFVGDHGLPVPTTVWSTLNPIFEDDAFVGWYFRVPGKDLYPITASSLDGWVELDTAGRAALAAGDVGFFSADGTRPADYIESPAALDRWGVRTAPPEAVSWSDIPDAHNILHDPFLDSHLGVDDLPMRWVPMPTSGLVRPTVTPELDKQFIRYGSRALRVQAQSGAGISSIEATLQIDPRRPYTGFRVALTPISGNIKAELWHSSGARYPLRRDNVAANLIFGTHSEFGSDGVVHDEPLAPGTVRLEITASGGPAEFVLDAAVVTQLAGDVPPRIVAGPAAHTLWERAVNLLAERSEPRVEYVIDVVDLHRMNPDRDPEPFGLGDVVRIVTPVLEQ
jgi:hypothetical protein